jgi:hypothetical protein
MPLNRFDRIFFINLDSRKDRREHTERLLNNLGVDHERIERISAVDSENGSLGCALSHIIVLEKIKSFGYKNALIIEDDIIQNTDDLESSLSVLDNLDYDLVMLSGNIIRYENVSDGIQRIMEAQTTAAYTVGINFVDKLIDSFRESVHMLKQNTHPDYAAIDQNWKKLQPVSKWYGISPMPFRQMPGYSDIEKINVDYRC